MRPTADAQPGLDDCEKDGPGQDEQGEDPTVAQA